MVILVASLFLLVTFSYRYLFALVVLVVSIIWLSIFVSLENNEKITDYFTLTEFGVISLKDERFDYQLLASTRLSFLGCWLVLQPIRTNNQSGEDNGKLPLMHWFIYRDSLNGQDFSRLVQVVKQLS